MEVKKIIDPHDASEGTILRRGRFNQDVTKKVLLKLFPRKQALEIC